MERDPQVHSVILGRGMKIQDDGLQAAGGAHEEGKEGWRIPVSRKTTAGRLQKNKPRLYAGLKF